RLRPLLPEADDPRVRGPRTERAGRSRHGRSGRPARLVRRRARVTPRTDRVSSLGERIKSLRTDRELQQRQLAEKAGLTPSVVSQIGSGRLTPSLNTLGKIAAALSVPIASLFDGRPAGRIQVTRQREYPAVSFDGSSERWEVLGAGLFQGKIRAVVSTLDAKSRGIAADKAV